jgi:Pyruvate/2-oxoacid:ferredoxin oxidoreductase gamma subunit
MTAMHNDWFDRYYPLVVGHGVLVYDDAKLDAALMTRNDVQHVAMPLAALAAEAGDPRAANMVVAGVVARLTGIASSAALAEGMTAVVPAHRADRIARNLHAVDVGYAWADAQDLDACAPLRVS